MKITGAVLEEVGRPGPGRETRPLTVGELDLEGPRAGEVLVQMEAAGVCHSDLSVVDGNRPRPVPMLLGHEACGRVTELGAGVTDLGVGQRVVMTFLPRCGACAGCATDGRMPCGPGRRATPPASCSAAGRGCRRDGRPMHHHLGVSAFATHAVVDTRSVVAVDDDVTTAVATVLGCAVLTGGGALLNAAPPEPGQCVMVVGLGGVGMAAVLTAVALGRGGRRGRRRGRGQARPGPGARGDDGARPDELEARGVRGRRRRRGGRQRAGVRGGAGGHLPGGRTVTVGLPNAAARASVSPLQLVAEARTVIGSYLGSAVPSRDIPVFAQWWREGRLPVEALVSSRIGLDDVNRAMDELAAGRAVRQLIEL